MSAAQLPPEHVKELLTRRLQNGEIIENFTPGQQGAMIGNLEEVCGGTRANRVLFMRYVWGVRSTNNLYGDHWQRLRSWLNVQGMPDPNNSAKTLWTIRAACWEEAREIIRLQREKDRADQIASGQLTLF